MTLNDAKLNTECMILSVDGIEYAAKLRLMELGLTSGTHVKVLHRSLFKKTLLISFYASQFTIKDDLAKGLQVVYV